MDFGTLAAVVFLSLKVVSLTLSSFEPAAFETLDDPDSEYVFLGAFILFVESPVVGMCILGIFVALLIDDPDVLNVGEATWTVFVVVVLLALGPYILDGVHDGTFE